MKNYLTTAILSLIVLTITSCEKSRDVSDIEIIEEPVAIQVMEHTNFNSRYEGSIDSKYGIYMSIQSNNGVVTGEYFYKKNGEPLMIQGTINNEGDMLLNEFDSNNNLTGVFRSSVSNIEKIEGVWSKPNGQSQMPFLLKKVNVNSQTIDEKSILDKKQFLGTYESPYNKHGISYSSVKIYEIIEDKFKFEISTAHQSGCTGGVEGIGIINEYGIGHWSSKECKNLTFEFSDNRLVINEAGCELYGLRCPFAGEYYK